jgi:diphthamide biosynthesis protein 4
MSGIPASQESSRPDTYYDILRLRCDDFGSLSKETLKSAYRRALLMHHPDKIPSNAADPALRVPADGAARYTIDEIVLAYETLSDPTKRAEYDHSLAQVNNGTWKSEGGHQGTHLGLETFDLEDLVYDEVSGTWLRDCRCGEERGYTLTESDLEKESQYGEIYVGCRGCSLFIKVQFAATET